MYKNTPVCACVNDKVADEFFKKPYLATEVIWMSHSISQYRKELSLKILSLALGILQTKLPIFILNKISPTLWQGKYTIA